MDLTSFATKKNADEGVWKQVELYDEFIDLDLLIYGSDSDVVKKYERTRFKNLVKTDKKGKTSINEESVEDILENENESICIRVGDVRSHKKHDEPVTINGKTITKDNISYLIEQIPAIKEFITEISNERENFLSVGKKN